MKKRNKILLYNLTNNKTIEDLLKELGILHQSDDLILLKDDKKIYYINSIIDSTKLKKREISIFIYEHPYKIISKNIKNNSLNITALENDFKKYIKDNRAIGNFYFYNPSNSLIIDNKLIDNNFIVELNLQLRRINLKLEPIIDNTEDNSLILDIHPPKITENIEYLLEENLKTLLNEAMIIYKKNQNYSGIKCLKNNDTKNLANNDSNELLLTKISILQEELQKTYLKKQTTVQKNQILGAGNIFKKQKAYRIGEKIANNYQSIGGIVKLPFILLREKNIKDEKLNIKLEDYSDYKEVENLKKHLRYKLGTAYLENSSSFIKLFKVPLILKKVYKEHQKDKK